MKFTYDPSVTKPFGLMDEGDYDFEVIHAEDCISKKGNEQIKLALKVTDKNLKDQTIFSYLTSPWQIYNFCIGINEPSLYKEGEINPVYIIGKKGRVKIGIQKDLTGQYEDRNKVVKFLKPVKSDNGVPAKEFDDEIPF